MTASALAKTPGTSSASHPVGIDTEENIRQAMIRNVTFDADRVHVTVAENTVTLTGNVRSFAERKQAATAAWASPHVSQVVNDIIITM